MLCVECKDFSSFYFNLFPFVCLFLKKKMYICAIAWMIMKIFSLWKVFVPSGHLGLDLLNRAKLCVISAISRTLQLVLTVSAQVFYKRILWGSRVCVCLCDLSLTYFQTAHSWICVGPPLNTVKCQSKKQEQ